MEVKSEGEEMSTAVQGYHSRPQVGIPTTQQSDNVSVQYFLKSQQKNLKFNCAQIHLALLQSFLFGFKSFCKARTQNSNNDSLI